MTRRRQVLPVVSAAAESATAAFDDGRHVEDFLVALDARDRMTLTVPVLRLVTPVVSAVADHHAAEEFTALQETFEDAVAAGDTAGMRRLLTRLEESMLASTEDVSPDAAELDEADAARAGWVQGAVLALYAACSVSEDLSPASFMDCWAEVLQALDGLDEAVGSATATLARAAAAASLAPAGDGDPQLRLRDGTGQSMAEVSAAVTVAADRLRRS
jgi:hypothetical protein